MKKFVLLFLGFCGLLAATEAGAQQTFTISDDTVKTSFASSDNIYNKVTNTSGVKTTYTWKVVATNFPASWSDPGAIGICDNKLCRNGIELNKGFDSDSVASGTEMDFHLQMNLENATENGPYYLVVNISDGVHDTDAVFVLSKWATGVSSVKKANDAVSIYPNPVRGRLNVTFSERSNIRNIAVYNLIGKPVSIHRVTNPNRAEINVEDIPSGVYFVRLIDAQGRVTAIRKFTHL